VRSVHDLNPEEIQFLIAVRGLPPTRRKKLLAVLEMIVARLRARSQESDQELVLDD
jgi:endonuclease III